MKSAQIFLTPNEGKKLIADALAPAVGHGADLGAGLVHIESPALLLGHKADIDIFALAEMI